jgi:hypothetical protein
LAQRRRDHAVLRIYTYSKCDTFRRALKFLRARKIVFEEIAIRETPPSEAELKAMATAYGNIRKLFNSSALTSLFILQLSLALLSPPISLARNT